MDNREIDKTIPKFWFSKRFFVAILMFFGTIHAGAMVANLNISIVDMTNIKRIKLLNETIIQEAEFNWDSKTKGFIMSVISYGFAVSALGSNLPMKLGGSTMVGISMVCSAILTISTPAIVRFNFHLYVLVRILEGLYEGLAYVSYAELWSKWAPLPDRFKLMSIGFSGVNAGAAIIYPICGYLIHFFGWPAAFYVTGCSSLIWSVTWLTLVTNDPASDKWISQKELTYIKENLAVKKRPQHVLPVIKNMFTSKCIWTLGFGKFAYAMGMSFIMKCFPMYLKDITNVEIHKIGILSALPQVLCFVTIPFAGYVIDYVQNKKLLTPTQTHKSFMCIGFSVGAVLLFCISLLHLEFVVTILCFIVFQMTLCLNYIIISIACICLAPQCSSLVSGAVMIYSCIGFIVGPMLVGFVVTDHSQEQWNLCISITGITLLISAFSYLIWGSGDPQPWSYSTEEDGENYNKLDLNEDSRL